MPIICSFLWLCPAVHLHVVFRCGRCRSTQVAVGELFAPQHEPGTDAWLKLVVGNPMLRRLLVSRPGKNHLCSFALLNPSKECYGSCLALKKHSR